VPEKTKTGTVVLSGPRGERGGLSNDTQARLDLGLNVWQDTGTPLILVGSSSELMKDELGFEPLGPPEGAIFIEPHSRETVGNAIYTKRDILLPEQFSAANLVTADYHMDRASRIFHKAMGGNFSINPFASQTEYSPQERRALMRLELIYSLIARLAFVGYSPESEGDDEMVLKRMQRIARKRYS